MRSGERRSGREVGEKGGEKRERSEREKEREGGEKRRDEKK